MPVPMHLQRQAMCEKPSTSRDQCDESQCDWILNSGRRSVSHGEGHGAARGWGNSVGYVPAHEVAAMLGSASW